MFETLLACTADNTVVAQHAVLGIGNLPYRLVTLPALVRCNLFVELGLFEIRQSGVGCQSLLLQ